MTVWSFISVASYFFSIILGPFFVVRADQRSVLINFQKDMRNGVTINLKVDSHRQVEGFWIEEIKDETLKAGGILDNFLK